MRRLPLTIAAVFSSVLLSFVVSAPLLGAEYERVLGHLEVLWGDPFLPELDPAIERIQIRSDNGTVTPLAIDGERPRGLLALVGRQVEVTVTPLVVGREEEPRTLRSLRAAPGGVEGIAGGAVTGSQPWVSILCKFADIATEPENLAYFSGMYANVGGGLDHYWREQSYGAIDVVGSQAFAWVTLPGDQRDYIPTPGSGTSGDLDGLFDDCTGAADPFVDFSNGGDPFVGINMMFNDLLDCCAWGGGHFATLDGVTKSWRTTWNPPWSFANEGVIAHEMGHGFGLPHSNNWDGDGNPYDSRWDMMSSSTGNAVFDPVYGYLGKHTLSYHKDRLAWIDSGALFEPTMDGTYTITIDHLALASTPNYRMARLVPPTGPRYYTVEVRKQVGNYDGALAGNAVILVEVDPGRSEPAWVVDSDVPPANTNNNEGSMWKVGETFVDPDFSVEVLSETADGFVVEITVGQASVIFEDGFESGDTTAWP